MVVDLKRHDDHDYPASGSSGGSGELSGDADLGQLHSSELLCTVRSNHTPDSTDVHCRTYRTA
jgi:hypothetical protein